MMRAARSSLAACLLAVACGGAQARRPPSASASPEEIDRGKALYDRYCALCHGAGAVGYAADNASQLRNPTFLETATDEFLTLAVERGRPGTPMSAFGKAHGGPLDREQIARVVAYLRSFARGPLVDVRLRQIEGDAERGAALFRQRCADCHGERGGGKTALSLNNPTFLATASDGFIRHAIEHGRPGTRMPAFGKLLDPRQIDDLTLAIRSWARAVEPGSPASRALPSVAELVLNPSGPRAELPLRDGRYVAADALAAALRAGSRLVILDARPLSDWHRGHIPGAFPMPFYDAVDSIIDAIPRDGTLVVAYCACPHAASGRVVDALRARGIASSAVLDEGILVWAERGYPMVATSAEPAVPR